MWYPVDRMGTHAPLYSAAAESQLRYFIKIDVKHTSI
jgi:hypothetical protein